MPRTGQAIGGAATGALSGAQIGSVIPGVGTAIGAGVGALAGLVTGLFSKSPEEEQRDRLAAYLKEIDAAEQSRIQTGVEEINRNLRGTAARSKKAAARRLLASGRTDDISTATVPVETQLANIGSEAISGFVTNTKGYFDTQRLQAQGTYAGRPMAPTAFDYFNVIAPAAGRYAEGQGMLDILRGGSPSPTGNVAAPGTIATPSPRTIPGMPQFNDTLSYIKNKYPAFLSN